MPKKILLVAGARPNFMKIAPIIAEIEENDSFICVLVHTGQHYDRNLSDTFFEDLNIPMPQYNLGVGSGSHAQQTAKIMQLFEPVLVEENPDLVAVVGDVNSTIACALVAVKMGFKVAHVESGLRSFDRTMPEEINRILTDQIADYLFVTEEAGVENLKREGIDEGKIIFVGNVMIDTLAKNVSKIDSSWLDEVPIAADSGYALVTIHRPSNVDRPEDLAEVVAILDTLQKKMPVVFPIHPRTQNKLEAFGFVEQIGQMGGLHIIPPQGYLSFIKLMKNARLILTDSGGIQEEVTFLGVPCLTMRENTERPVTITHGTNVLVGRDWAKIESLVAQILTGKYRTPNQQPPLWDGNAAKRMIEFLRERL